MSSVTRFVKLVSRSSSQYHAPRILSSSSGFRHHGLARKSGYQNLSSCTRLCSYNTQTRKFSVNSSSGVEPSAPLPPPPPSPSSYSRWILGLVMSIIVPSTSNTWLPILQFKEDVDAVVETIEEIVEVVEKVAEIVDMVADEISEDLPEGGKLKKAVDMAEDVAEAIAKDARIVGDAIDKFQEVGEKVEDMVETPKTD